MGSISSLAAECSGELLGSRAGRHDQAVVAHGVPATQETLWLYKYQWNSCQSQERYSQSKSKNEISLEQFSCPCSDLDELMWWLAQTSAVLSMLADQFTFTGATAQLTKSLRYVVNACIRLKLALCTGMTFSFVYHFSLQKPCKKHSMHFSFPFLPPQSLSSSVTLHANFQTSLWNLKIGHNLIICTFTFLLLCIFQSQAHHLLSFFLPCSLSWIRFPKTGKFSLYSLNSIQFVRPTDTDNMTYYHTLSSMNW